MINKQVKIVGGVNRSTPIDLRTIDAEVAALAGRSPRTPIGMKELWDEVQNLKVTAKSWEIVTLNKSGKTNFPFDSKFSSYNFIVLKYNIRYMSDGSTYSYARNYNNDNFGINYENNRKNGNISFSKSGNNLVVNQGYPDELSSTITVLFYK